MKVAIMQPYLFPYIGYYQLINMVDIFVIYDDVQYIKGGWINRNRMLLNGKAHMFRLTLQKDSMYKLINERKLSNKSYKDIQDLLKTIEVAYHKAPFFYEVYPIIKTILEFNTDSLSELLIRSLEEINDYLEINTKFIRSSELIKRNELKGQDKIINICEILQAKDYINPIGGIELYDKEVFRNKGINLHFIKKLPLVYKQFNSNFIDNLSIMDVLMFNSKDQIHNMLNAFSLI